MINWPIKENSKKIFNSSRILLRSYEHVFKWSFACHFLQMSQNFTKSSFVTIYKSDNEFVLILCSNIDQIKI